MVSRVPSASRGKVAAKPASGPGRPKDLGKRAAILEAAKKLFSSEGFAGVSMDQIAAAAGVSKLTVYSHFGDKEALFTAAVLAKCQEFMPDDLFQPQPDGPLREQLRAIGHAFFALISSDEAISTHRMMLAGNVDDHLREMFWQAGPQRTCAAFAAMLKARADRGELDIPDLERAAQQFFTLIKGKLHARMMCGLCQRPVRSDLGAHIDAGVELFLRAYERR